MWRHDLKEFLAKLDEVEQKEREDAAVRKKTFEVSTDFGSSEILLKILTSLL